MDGWLLPINKVTSLGAYIRVVRGKWSNPFELPARKWLFLGLSGLVIGASWVCQFRALQLGEASKVAPVDKMSLVLVPLFAFTFLGKRPSFREWSGITMVAGGFMVSAFK
jgi:transporter family protein